MNITRKFYGNTEDKNAVDIFTLSNSKGMTAEITNFGGTVVSLRVPDRSGNFEDIVLGFDDLEGYKTNKPYFGGIIGRYANRIEGGRFRINGVDYQVAKNDGDNHLHGGIKGFNKVLWNAEIEGGEEEGLVLSYTSKDGEEGYPGKLEVKVTYTLTGDNALKIDYSAVSDKDTAVNLTNHSYFNLSGHGSGEVLKHEVMINADMFTPINEKLIPSGEVARVKGTPMDLTVPLGVEKGLSSECSQIVYAGGYDHNWVLNTCGDLSKLAASVFERKSGRLMEVFTTQLGVQFYTGNFLDGSYRGKNGAIYNKRSALCLETQNFPNAINITSFPSPILKAGEEYKHTTIYKFSTI